MAALDRLGIRKYDGDRYEVLCLKKADFAAQKSKEDHLWLLR